MPKTLVSRVSSSTSRVVLLRPYSANPLFMSRETFKPSTSEATPALSMYLTISRFTITRFAFFSRRRLSKVLRTSGVLYSVMSPITSTIAAFSTWRVEMFILGPSYRLLCASVLPEIARECNGFSAKSRRLKPENFSSSTEACSAPHQNWAAHIGHLGRIRPATSAQLSVTRPRPAETDPNIVMCKLLKQLVGPQGFGPWANGLRVKRVLAEQFDFGVQFWELVSSTSASGTRRSTGIRACRSTSCTTISFRREAS